MELLIIVLLATAVLGATLVAIGGEFLFRRRLCGQHWLALRTQEIELRRLAETKRGQIDDAAQALTRQANLYETAYIDGQLRRRPIRDLRRYISVTMSWTALERAGIDNLASFLDFRGDFHRIHGIGDARANALAQARHQLAAEVQGMTVPVPGLSRPGTPEFQTVTALIRACEIQHQAAPPLLSLEAGLQHLREQRPSPLVVRARCLLGRSEGRGELSDRLHELRQQLQDLASDQVPTLEHNLQQAAQLPTTTEALGHHYARLEDQAIRLLAQVISRPLRGSLRPYGIAALRAAEGFESEEDFCDRVLEPFVAKLGYDHIREFTMNRRVGSRTRTMYVDFLLLDDQGHQVGILEAKHSIRNQRQQRDAREQAKSYATFEELTPCLVAAKEGLWIYERQGQTLIPHGSYDMEEAFARASEIRQIVDRIR